MSFQKSLIIILFLGFYLMILSCQRSVDYNTYQFDQPKIPNIELFDLNFIGMESGSAGKIIGSDQMNWQFEINGTSKNDIDWDPAKTALMYLNDFFRTGMLNNLRWIYNTTFDMGENSKAEQNENIFTWRYNTELYDPNKGSYLINSDVTLIATLNRDQWIEWELYREMNGEKFIIASGQSNKPDNSGEWTFYHHNNSKTAAFQFKWQRENNITTSFQSTLYFVDVTSHYEHQNERINLEMDINDNPQLPVYTEINWSQITGEGHIKLVSTNIDQKKCWDEEKIEIDNCPP